MVAVWLTISSGSLCGQPLDGLHPWVVVAVEPNPSLGNGPSLGSGSSSFQPSSSAAWIANQAYRQSDLANAIQQELTVSSAQRHATQRQLDNRAIRVQFMQAIARRHRQVAAAQALKLHYGIAALMESLQLLDAIDTAISEQMVAQKKLVESGIPIADPLQLERAKSSLFDEALEKRSRLFTLRSQLSVLVGQSIACNYSPVETIAIVPKDDEVCCWMEMGDRCRPEVSGLRALRSTITPETLDTWAQIASVMLMTPDRSPVVLSVFQPLTRLFHARDKEKDVERRRTWVDARIVERCAQIHSEVEVAFDQKRTAALRWVQAQEVVVNWETRIQQLERMAENRGNLPDQFQARLAMLRSRGALIERWSDWQQANVDLRLASGDDFQ